MTRKLSRGLSMPELMVAMTILFVVSTFIMSMFVTGMRQTAQASQNHGLESLTREKLSELRVMAYDQLDTVNLAGTFPAPDSDFSYEIEYSRLESADLADARVVDVTVSHPEYGSRNGRTVRSNVQINPGKAAWEKFECGTCHSLASAGYTTVDLMPLGPIPVNDPSNPRPIGPGGIAAYVAASVEDPTQFTAYTDQGTMSDFYIEGDADYDPNSADAFVAANSMSQEELDALASWIASLQ